MTTPTLTGDRVRLEPLTLDHLPALEKIAFDDTIWRYMLAWVRTPQDLLRWAEDALAKAATGNSLPWVTTLPDGTVIGASRFLDYDPKHRTVEIGHTWLAAPYRGTGLNTEVKLLQLTYAFEDLDMRRVALKTHHENACSRAAILALGATEEGTFRNHLIMPDGSTRHSVWYSITNEDWPSVKERLQQRIAKFA